MAEAAAAEQAPEVIPNDLIIAELQRALHEATSQIVILRARIAARDRQAAQAPAMPAPPVPVPVANVDLAGPEREGSL